MRTFSVCASIQKSEWNFLNTVFQNAVCLLINSEVLLFVIVIHVFHVPVAPYYILSCRK